MTTNEDRAQRIVGGVIDRLTTDKSGVPVATRVTQALADAGLIMPDLPKPTFAPKSDTGWAEEYRSNWDYDPPIAVWEDSNTNWWVAVFADGETSGGWSEYAEEELSLLSAEKLRGIASLMLAAATKIDQITNHAEQEQSNE